VDTKKNKKPQSDDDDSSYDSEELDVGVEKKKKAMKVLSSSDSCSIRSPLTFPFLSLLIVLAREQRVEQCVSVQDKLTFPSCKIFFGHDMIEDGGPCTTATDRATDV